MNEVADVLRELSVHYGQITARLHEESVRLAANASDEPITKRELSEAFDHISAAFGVFQAALFSLGNRLARTQMPGSGAAPQAGEQTGATWASG